MSTSRIITVNFLKQLHSTMHFCKIGAIALSVALVDAFQDTSPFFFFSSSELLISSPQIVSAASLTKILSANLDKCPSDTYVIVSQPRANAADFSAARSAPHLRKRISGLDENVRSSVGVADVLGVVDTDLIQSSLEEKCQAGLMTVDASTGSFSVIDDMKPRVIRVDFPPLPAVSRAAKLAEHDAFLASIIDLLPSPKYTVIYTTSPITTEQHSLVSESRVYEMDNHFPSSAHMNLKRDFSTHEHISTGNSTLPNGPLFETYQFFTPGIFMGLLVGFLLLSILYVAISGLAGLQVSYAAFDREMGPSAQKKQQQ